LRKVVVVMTIKPDDTGNEMDTYADDIGDCR
jgi:hypothetical protein